MEAAPVPDGDITYKQVLGEPEETVTRFFQEARHVEDIAGIEEDTEERDIWLDPQEDGQENSEEDKRRIIWRRKYGKERMKTVSVALCLCLHIGVDPPDRDPRPQPCAKLQAWCDPFSCSAQKAMAKIAASLQKNYERWQPRARYKVAADPTLEEVRRICVSMRRNAKDERVLFHYNGHGVPRPTSNGEIWVFNKNYTQYIPLSIYDLQSWMETPSIYVWDCDSAETIIQSFNRFAGDHEREWTVALDDFQERNDSLPPILSSMSHQEQADAVNFNRRKPRFRDCIQLAACRTDQNLPTNPDLPADLFTSCLTTPIQMSIKWYLIRVGRKEEFESVMKEIPGQLTDRRTLLGELNWIFTAITDTIAWNVLPRDLFQRLFRQDLLLASLFRSFLLAERIMGAYGCDVVSVPTLPSTAEHILWQSWEYTIDLCLSHLTSAALGRTHTVVCPVAKDFFRRSHIIQLNNLLDLSSNQQVTIQGEGTDSQHTWFFIEQLRAFEVWLEYGVQEKLPPVQLPVVLQVLLSQVHRVRALELLARFLDHGQWAVGYALSVGIFPYVLKLLQSNTKELKPWLAFIWAKILAVDPGCQAELFKENGEESRYDIGQRKDKKELRYLYFVKILNDPLTTPRQKIVPAFVLATLFHNNYKIAQQNLTEQGYVNLCTELLSDPDAKECRLLKLWILIGLGKLWQDYNNARWQAVRLSAYSKVLVELSDSAPEVRAAAVYALGCLVKNRTEQNEHAQQIAQEICDGLCSSCTRDGAVLVRLELLVALQYFVMDTATTLVSLHKRLEDRASRMSSREDSRWYDEADSTFDGHSISMDEHDKSSMSIRSERSFLGRRRKEPSESNAILEELAAAAARAGGVGEHNSALKAAFPTAFASEDVVYRDKARKMLSLLETKNFADPHERIWIAVLRLSLDPIDKVARMAQTLVKYISRLTDEKQLARINSHLGEFLAPKLPPPAEVFAEENGHDEVDLACSPPIAPSPIPPSLVNSASSSAVTFTVGSPQATGSCFPVRPPPCSTPLGPTRKISLPVTSTPKPNRDETPFVPPLLPIFLPKRRIAGRESRAAKAASPSELTPHEALLGTQFVPWCSRVFIEPILDLIQGETTSDGMTDPVLTRTNPTDWSIHTEEGMNQIAKEEFGKVLSWSCKMSENAFCVHVEGSAGTRRGRGPLSIAFSQLRSYLYFSDGDNIGIVGYDEPKASIVRHWPNHGGSAFTSERCSWVSCMNGQSREMLLSGSHSGVIRVWDPQYCANSHKLGSEMTLVTAAFPLADQARLYTDKSARTDVTFYDWSQQTGRLVCAGNVKVCRVWDAHCEKASLDLQVTAKRGTVCALSADLDESSLIAIGLRDGAVHVHDTRMPAGESRILSLAEHVRPLVGVAMRSREEDGRAVIAAASDDGLLCVWEPRMYKEAIVQRNVLEGDKDSLSTLSSMQMHSSCQIVSVCVRGSEEVRVFDISGRPISSLDCGGSLPGRPASLAFHPHRPLLAVATTREGEHFLSAYGPPPSSLSSLKK